MAIRLFFTFGLILFGATTYFIVVQQDPSYQAAPATSSFTQLQEEGILPTGPFEENEEIEHDVFEVPPMDEMMLEQAMSNMDMGDMDMGGSDMGDMDMSNTDGGTMTMADGGTMTMPDGSTMPMADMGGTGEAMTMADGDMMKMPDGSMMPMADMAPSGDAMAMADGDTMTMPDGSTMPMADMGMAASCEGESGLGFCADGAPFDREITLAMSEWTFADLNVDVKEGERIRFTVRNDGTVLHEFMFMAMAQMQAVNYRALRADWNLLEHEALFEQSLLLPGQSISFVAEIQSTGTWMFMCMLPYHMQMGMMGQISTPGMAMDM